MSIGIAILSRDQAGKQVFRLCRPRLAEQLHALLDRGRRRGSVLGGRRVGQKQYKDNS